MSVIAQEGIDGVTAVIGEWRGRVIMARLWYGVGYLSTLRGTLINEEWVREPALRQKTKLGGQEYDDAIRALLEAGDLESRVDPSGVRWFRILA